MVFSHLAPSFQSAIAVGVEWERPKIPDHGRFCGPSLQLPQCSIIPAIEAIAVTVGQSCHRGLIRVSPLLLLEAGYYDLDPAVTNREGPDYAHLPRHSIWPSLFCRRRRQAISVAVPNRQPTWTQETAE
jgi:hypothetical protein